MDDKKRAAANLAATKQYEFASLCGKLEFLLQDCKQYQDFLKSIKGLPPNEQEYKRKFLLAQVLNKLGVWP